MDTSTVPVPENIERYADAARQLRGSSTLVDQQLTDIVLLRENIAREIASLPLEAKLLKSLQEGDECLRDIVKKNFTTSTLKALKRCRETIGGDPTRWWLNIDEMAIAEGGKHSWMWTALSGILFAVAIGFMTDVGTRFLKDGPDFYSGIATAFQAAVAILTGAAFMNSFWSWLERALLQAPLSSNSRSKIHVLIAMIAVAIMVAVYAMLPTLARFYNDLGVDRSSRGAVSSAVSSFKRALALDPDFSLAHYNLGDAYERAFLPEQAMSEYRLAMLLEPQHARSSNNLARLIVMEGKNVPAALQILDRLISEGEAGRAALETDQWYAAYKNRGWAFLALKEPLSAARDLQMALTYNAEGGSAYCLLAKAMKKISTAPVADVEGAWRKCVAFAPGDESTLASWIQEARTALGGAK